MPDELNVHGRTIRLITGFITELKEIDGIVHYARPDLKLGAGFGTAISLQGGAKVQEELKKFGSAGITEVVVTSGGNLQARHILHAVGPQFQEENMEAKLRATTLNTLQKAEKHKLRRIAMPAMGAGFYGIPLPTCARITIEAARDFLENAVELEEVVFCLRDRRELNVFREYLQNSGRRDERHP